MEILTVLEQNWEVVLASLTAAVIGADKVLLIVITTLGNIRDTWLKTFPKVCKIKDLEIKKAPLSKDPDTKYQPVGIVRKYG